MSVLDSMLIMQHLYLEHIIFLTCVVMLHFENLKQFSIIYKLSDHTRLNDNNINITVFQVYPLPHLNFVRIHADVKLPIIWNPRDPSFEWILLTYILIFYGGH